MKEMMSCVKVVSLFFFTILSIFLLQVFLIVVKIFQRIQIKKKKNTLFLLSLQRVFHFAIMKKRDKRPLSIKLLFDYKLGSFS
jgi:uncharacterized membrane protein YagU involved in acid resistance